MHMAQESDNIFIIRPLQESEMWHITVNIIALIKKYKR